jgi:hypothetical protein
MIEAFIQFNGGDFGYFPVFKIVLNRREAFSVHSSGFCAIIRPALVGDHSLLCPEAYTK